MIHREWIHTLNDDPAVDCLFHMSPYLHFGQISPLSIALEILKPQSSGSSAYLEQLTMRRELSMIIIHYNNQYDGMKGLPAWTQKTL